MKTKMKMYGVILTIENVTVSVGNVDYDSGREIIIKGQSAPEMFDAVRNGLELIQADEEKCESNENNGTCFCWACRMGAGRPIYYRNKFGDTIGIGYQTGSGHGTYSIYADGMVEVEGSPRSLGDGSEYAWVNVPGVPKV